MAKPLQSYGYIHNDIRFCNEFRERVPHLRKASTKEVIEDVEESVRKADRIRYFNNDYLELDEKESGKSVMWLDSGYRDCEGNVLYIQFTGGNPWHGCYIGTEKEIIEYQKSYQESKNAESSLSSKEVLEKDLGVNLDSIGVNFSSDGDTENASEPTKTELRNADFLESLLSKLLIQKDWNIYNLDEYLKTCIIRLNYLLKENENCIYCKFNEDKSLALINSGLLDSFGKYIYLVLKVRPLTDMYQLSIFDIQLAGSKVSLIKVGFDRNAVNFYIERVSFCSSNADLVFKGDLQDFDLENTARLTHCLVERRDRFPESWKSAGEDALFSDMLKAIEVALEINRYDHNYIKPIYHRKSNKIHFVIPYHVGNSFQTKPELGIVVALIEGFWQVMTILSSEDAKDDTRLFSLYSSESF